MIINNAPATMFRVGRRARRSGQWKPGTKHRKYDDAEIVARGLVLGGEASATRIWKVGQGAPQLLAKVASVKFGADVDAVVRRVE
jgi:hypothetical protein